MKYRTDEACPCGCPMDYDDVTGLLVCTSELCDEERAPPPDMPRPADRYGR